MGFPFPKIYGYGDSITAGTFYASYLTYFPASWHAVNKGYAGEYGAVWSAPPNTSGKIGTVRLHDDLVGNQITPGSLVVLMWGTNDVGNTLWGVPNPPWATQLVNNLLGAVDLLNTNGYTPVLVAPPPQFTNSDAMDRLTALEASLRAGMATRAGYYVDAFHGIPDPSYLSVDDVHLNDAGEQQQVSLPYTRGDQGAPSFCEYSAYAFLDPRVVSGFKDAKTLVEIQSLGAALAWSKIARAAAMRSLALPLRVLDDAPKGRDCGRKRVDQASIADARQIATRLGQGGTKMGAEPNALKCPPRCPPASPPPRRWGPCSLVGSGSLGHLVSSPSMVVKAVSRAPTASNSSSSAHARTSERIPRGALQAGRWSSRTSAKPRPALCDRAQNSAARYAVWV